MHIPASSIGGQSSQQTSKRPRVRASNEYRSTTFQRRSDRRAVESGECLNAVFLLPPCRRQRFMAGNARSIFGSAKTTCGLTFAISPMMQMIKTSVHRGSHIAVLTVYIIHCTSTKLLTPLARECRGARSLISVADKSVTPHPVRDLLLLAVSI
jgi:hypothetical protein